MYSVSTPANAYANKQQDRTGNATRNDFKKAKEGYDKNQNLRILFDENSPQGADELAVRILQMHAATHQEAEKEPPQPTLFDSPEDGEFVMPDVLKRPNRPTATPTRNNQKDARQTERTKRAPKPSKTPSSKLLLASTLILGAIGGALLTLGLPGLLESQASTARTAATESIGAPIASDTIQVAGLDPSVATAAPEPVTTRVKDTSRLTVPEVTAAQVEAAKERIRAAFAAGSQAAPAPVQEAAASMHSNEAALRNVATTIPNMPKSIAEEIAPGSLLDGQRPQSDVSPSSADDLAVAVSDIPYDSRTAGTDAETSVTQALDTETDIASAMREPSATPLTSAAYPNLGRTTASLNMRKSKDKNGTVIAIVPQGAQLAYADCGTWWCAVSYEGKPGFVGQKYLQRQTDTN